VKIYFHVRKPPKNTVFEFIKNIARIAVVLSYADPHGKRRVSTREVSGLYRRQL